MQPDTLEAKPRPWAIGRRCLVSSLALASLAEFLLVAAVLVARLSGNRNLCVMILPLIWPVFYAVVYGISLGTAKVDQAGPVLSGRPKWYQNSYPPFLRQFINAAYSLSASAGLLIFPTMAVLMSSVVLWLAATRQLNP
jgi:hypothetical protein